MNSSTKINISYIILEGPDCVLSNNLSTTYDCILRVTKFPFNPKKENHSFGIFVDNTNNKHNNFLNPILRTATYIKHEDLPIVKYYKIPKNYFDTLDKIISTIDLKLANIKFLKAGLIMDRISPNGCNNIWEEFQSNFSYEIYRWNYCQQINYRFGIKQSKPNLFAKSLTSFINFCNDNKSNFLTSKVEESFGAEKDYYIKKYYKQRNK